MNDLPRLENYHIDHLIAEGGTARVYWGIDKRSGFAVAIKELKLRHMNNAVIRENFRNMETQLMLYAQHPNIPRLVEFIDLPRENQMFLVMEFIEGRSLEHYIYREVGLIPEQRALPIFLEVVDTIAFLHRVKIPHLGIYNGVLHLDIKSNNVMMQPNGRIKIIDLGIASRMDDGGGSTGFGTPAYMPPEQSSGGQCGRYTDIFALGVMLFEMLTGHLPFLSDSPDMRQNRNEVRQKIMYEPTPLMKGYYPMIGDDLQYIVNRATAKNPVDRYQTCEQLALNLRRYMQKNNIKHMSR
ncbi:MAG: serine/threonine protein kinase [Bacteroidales bacterium]|nr:serine/threonine protein kinase [Bacteroidales bacterium]